MRAAPPWQHRIPVDDQVVFLHEVARALSALQAEVVRCHPSFIGTTFSINADFVSQDREEPETADAVDPSAASTGTPSTRDVNSSSLNHLASEEPPA